MFKNITLELSLKPFKKTDDEYIKGVCAKIFEQWHALLKNRESISIMLWVGDGSEILDYAGDMDDTFEWCRFLGTANLPLLSDDEPPHTSLHERKQHYMPNAPVFRYKDLKKVIDYLKSEGKKAFPGSEIRVGETFDIGPEFAISDFKYNRHTEIIAAARLDHFGFVDSTAELHADNRKYAAYPCGIPEGTPFGKFLGMQSQEFLTDMGFDYLWLSNGLGFSADPWDKTGKIFDGENYYIDKLDETKRKVFDFWKLFREGCSFPLEVRGTNNSVGIDYASDGVPLYDIYNAGLNIVAPPNSPWAALTDDFGLEMMGHMTRVCELPNDRFPFRYYVHDPWWINSPWYDRYDGAPSDIYLPASISRINEKGEVESANSLNVLSIDNSYGNMPDACVNEPLPHLLKAEKNAPDAPAPLVWVYPMREYTTTHDETVIREMNLGDNFINAAINDGFPLCCVVSTDNFVKHSESVYKKSVLISPVPETPAVLDKLIDFAAKGIGVIVYGTKQKLETVPNVVGIFKADVEDKNTSLREMLANFGYHISFSKVKQDIKPPTMSISRYDNALLLSVYSNNTTVDTHLKFPLGAPVLCGRDTELVGGAAVYNFSRGEQRECRIYVEQESGVITCREKPPVNAYCRRSILISGLENATVRLFSEKGSEGRVSRAKNVDVTPEFADNFVEVTNEFGETYLEGKNISGQFFFSMGKKKK